jgi:hypothetical protein
VLAAGRERGGPVGPPRSLLVTPNPGPTHTGRHVRVPPVVSAVTADEPRPGRPATVAGMVPDAVGGSGEFDEFHRLPLRLVGCAGRSFDPTKEVYRTRAGCQPAPGFFLGEGGRPGRAAPGRPLERMGEERGDTATDAGIRREFASQLGDVVRVEIGDRGQDETDSRGVVVRVGDRYRPVADPCQG